MEVNAHLAMGTTYKSVQLPLKINMSTFYCISFEREGLGMSNLYSQIGNFNAHFPRVMGTVNSEVQLRKSRPLCDNFKMRFVCMRINLVLTFHDGIRNMDR